MTSECCYRFIKEKKTKDPGVDVTVATKFAALPWRLGRRSVICVLKDSLARLGLASVDLYQLHWSVPVDSSKQLLFTTYIAFDSLYWLVLALFLRPGIWGNEGCSSLPNLELEFSL